MDRIYYSAFECNENTVREDIYMRIRLYLLHFLSLFVCLAHAGNDELIDTTEKINGLTQSDYANVWWQWAISMSSEESPVRDQTGAKCAVGQRGPVWFLAGGYGSSHIQRHCHVPAGKYIYFPVINMLYYPGNEQSRLSCEEAMQSAAVNNDSLQSFRVSIDGHEYVNPALFRRASSKCFDLIARKHDKYTHTMVYPSATDGYWVMLKPLPPGQHHLSFGARYYRPGSSEGMMIQDIEYMLDVE
jgi:hypothetical protein